MNITLLKKETRDFDIIIAAAVVYFENKKLKEQLQDIHQQLFPASYHYLPDQIYGLSKYQWTECA